MIKAFRKTKRGYKKAQRLYMKSAKVKFRLIVLGALAAGWKWISEAFNYVVSYF